MKEFSIAIVQMLRGPQVRELTTVIGQMLDQIPIEQAILRRSLESIKSTASLSTPEMMSQHWGEVGMELFEHFPLDMDGMNEWQTKVAKIWLDQPGGEASV